jgi:hypothetical protein
MAAPAANSWGWPHETMEETRFGGSEDSGFTYNHHRDTAFTFTSASNCQVLRLHGTGGSHLQRHFVLLEVQRNPVVYRDDLGGRYE